MFIQWLETALTGQTDWVSQPIQPDFKHVKRNVCTCSKGEVHLKIDETQQIGRQKSLVLFKLGLLYNSTCDDAFSTLCHKFMHKILLALHGNIYNRINVGCGFCSSGGKLA